MSVEIAYADATAGPQTVSQQYPLPISVANAVLPTNPSAVVSGQIVIAVTNTAVPLPSHALQNGVVIKAKSTNTGNGFVGASNVTTTDDGTGNGYRILPGEATSLAVANTNALYVNGTAGDVYYYIGN